MLITIDLGSSDEVLIESDATDVAETKRLEDERQREAWLNYILHNEAVVPQVVPVTNER